MEYEIDIYKNHGVLPEVLSVTDYIVGGVTGVTPDNINTDATWRDSLPVGEIQKPQLVDFMDCVTMSACHSLAMQVNLFIQLKLLTVEEMAWLHENGYLDDHGLFNISERFTAKMSGTTRDGNNGGRVWNSLRNDGFIPEKDWPTDKTMTWEDFYAEIPQHLKDKALRYTECFQKIVYEKIMPSNINMESFEEMLRTAPIQIFTPVCPVWSQDDPIKACDREVQHATIIYEVGKYYQDFDSYIPFQKELDVDYPMPYAMRGIIRPLTKLAMFTDVQPTDPNYEQFKTAYDLGIIHGYGDGSLKPDQQITRREAILIALNTYNVTKKQ